MLTNIFDFRLQVFLAVARHLSFTKAAEELLISQPAVTKHIAEIERAVGRPVFHRSKRSIELTPEGEILMAHALKIEAQYRQITDDMAQCTGVAKGKLTVGASTTIAQYILPGIAARFKHEHPNVELSIMSGNSTYIEKLLTDERIDIGMIESNSNRTELHYRAFANDEIVLVGASAANIPSSVTANELKQQKIALREMGSGTLDVVMAALRKNGIKPSDLNIDIRIDSTEGIKRYIQYSSTLAFLSMFTIVNELKLNKLKIIDTPWIDVRRTLHFITLHGAHAPLAQRFEEFAINNFRLL